MTDLGESPEELVYNLNIGDTHTYSVGVGDDNVLTHNSSCGHGRFCGPGKKFTNASKKIVYKLNAMKYGVARCEYCGVPLRVAKKSSSARKNPLGTNGRRTTGCL